VFLVHEGRFSGYHPSTNRMTAADQGATVSSSSIQQAGPQLQAAAAEIRREVLRPASAKLGISANELSVSGGIVSGGGRSVEYGELIGAEGEQIVLTGKAPQKNSALYKIVGSRVPRRDLPVRSGARARSCSTR
jgi:nicotinate dehydrogenase subunit B